MLKFIFDFYEKRLIKKLSYSSIDVILEKTKDNSYFFPYNIWMKYFDRRTLIEGGKQISWFAYRQIEKVNNVEEFEYLQSIIDKTSDTELINSIYFALGHLAKNTKEIAIFNFLISRLNTESEENIITILIAIKDCKKPFEYNLEPIYDIIRNSKIPLKVDAVLSLNKSINPKSEELLIETFTTAKNVHLKTMIAATLRI